MSYSGFLYFLLLLSMSNAYKILVVFHLPGRSHINLGDGLVRLLLEAEHEVTYFTPFPREKPPANLHQIDISSPELKYGFSFENFLNKDYHENSLSFIMKATSDLSRKMVMLENVQTFLNDTRQEFDVLITEWTLSELLSGFSVVYDCPLIWLAPVDPFWLLTNMVDEHANPAYTTTVNSFELPPFNLLQRAHELWRQIYEHFCLNHISSRYDKTAYHDLIAPFIAKRGREVPPYDQVRYNASLILGSSDPSLGQPIKLPANYKPVGGYFINRNVEPLPKYILDIMDSATNGIIYFSLGSNVKSKDMPESIKRGIMKVFGELNQTVLWKYEEPMPDAPKNVRVLQWAPQQSILAHPNCILFITHMGLLSMTEAVHFGVPIIGMPVFVDQFLNVEGAVRRGIGRRVDLSYTMAEDLKVAISDVLTNPSYSEKAKEWSQVYHDRPISPGAELVHWVEHVIRTRGATYLRSDALMVPWYQKMYLDLILLLVIMYFSIKYTVKRFVKLCGL